MATATDTPVLILTGPPGADKTTTAEILAARLDSAVHLEADPFFRFIRSGCFTIVDGIVIPRWFLGRLRGVIAAAGLSVAYAVPRPPLAVCAERVDAREGGPPADPGVIQQLWTEFADLGELEPNAVGLGEESSEEAADAVARLLADGKLAL